MARKEPRWVVAFLRALERTGEARAAAADAGVDHSTAYARRRAHAGFGEAWAEALAAHKAAKERAEAEEIAAIRAAPASLPHPLIAAQWVPPSPSQGRGADGEELVASGGKMRRVGPGRWGKAKEKRFFDELAATNNIGRSAAAAGVSTNAVNARRLRHPLFAAKWDAVASVAKAAINMHLLEETRKSFDPDQLDTGDVTPRVSIDQAIRISQIGASKAQERAFEDEAEMGPGEVEALRERVLKKLRRLIERFRREKLEQGWTWDESTQQLIPPGWIRPG